MIYFDHFAINLVVFACMHSFAISTIYGFVDSLYMLSNLHAILLKEHIIYLGAPYKIFLALKRCSVSQCNSLICISQK